jgi:hypothetical protein
MAASFDYHPDNLGGDASRPMFMALAGASREIKVGFFDLDNATGLQAVTGVGFEPDALILIGGRTGAGFGSVEGASMHWGACGPDLSQCGGGLFFPDGTAAPGSPRSTWQNDRAITCPINAGIDFEAAVDSLDSDGFTMDILDAPAADQRIGYMAMRGAGDYAVDNALSPTGTGTQSITGLGFAPTAVFLFHSQAAATGFSLHAPAGWGGGDGTKQFAAWCREESGDVRTTSRGANNRVIIFARDATGPALAGATVLQDASLQSLDADGFTLNWQTADGTQRHFGWIAFQGPIEVNDFEYDEASLANVRTVTLDMDDLPHGIIGWSPNPSTAVNSFIIGASICLSLCGPNGDDEISISSASTDSPPLNVLSSASELQGPDGTSFRCFISVSGAPTGAFGGRPADIFVIEGVDAEFGAISMNWRYGDRRAGMTQRALSGVGPGGT